MTRTRLVLAALACAALVAHLLFIPYAYSPLTFGEALQRFARIQWFQLGSDQNVALVSRALMFLPLGLLLAACVAPQPRGRFEWPAWLAACLLGCAWAVAVNFAQVWFPGRTVNLNNVAAEFCGVIAGGLLWSTLGASGQQWWRQLASGGHFSLSAGLNAYVVLYLVASLLPFDFVTSAGELAEKAATDLYGLWVAPVGCGPAPCGLKFLAMLIAAVPCGWWFAARRRGVGNVWLAAAVVAAIVATAIELLHFLMVSGVSQGASVLMRTLGMALGAATYSWRQRLAALDLNRYGRPAVLALLAPYLVAIAYVGGWFRAQKLGIAAGLARMDEVVWLPFFHQYYAPYNATMSSALVHVALYAPVGAMCWLWARRRDRAPLWIAALLAIALAFFAETSKVFLVGRVSDYTDVFIAAASATLMLAMLRFSSGSQQPRQNAVLAASAEVTPRPDSAISQQTTSGLNQSVLARLVGALLLAVALWTAVDFPIAAWAMSMGLLVYAALLFRFPLVYLIAVPLLLPVYDLAPLSGRFFWDEFDALLAVTLGIRLLMPLPPPREMITLPRGALWLLALSVAASTVIGLAPLDPLDANAFSNYLSSYNALRVAKGYVWAGVLLWLIWRDACGGRDVTRLLALGLALGLLAATAGVFWERAVFVGLLDWGAYFRAAGLVSSTHVGGAYLEALLVALAPFALALAVSAERVSLRVIWFGVALAGASAVLMTLSRAAFAAWLISAVVFFGIWWIKSLRPGTASIGRAWRWGAGGAVIGLLAFALWAAQSTYLRERFTLSSGDLSLRASHWKGTVALMRADALHLLLGMGLGSFPREFYLANASSATLPAYRIERDPATSLSYLALIGGRGMYFDQRLLARSDGELRLTGKIRTRGAKANLSVGICEKSMLNSTLCEWSEVSAGQTWQPFTLNVSMASTGKGTGVAAPVSLSIHNPVFGTRVEIAELSLLDAGREILRNGSFSRGGDHWFFTSDVHAQWRALNTPLQIWFEQGLLGVFAWVGLLVAAAAAGGTRLATAPVLMAATAGAVGLLFVSCLDTLVDSPRAVLLVALVGLSALISRGARVERHALADC